MLVLSVVQGRHTHEELVLRDTSEFKDYSVSHVPIGLMVKERRREMLSDNDFLIRVGDYFDTGELADLLKISVWDFMLEFEDEILSKREALIEYMECEDEDDLL